MKQLAFCHQLIEKHTVHGNTVICPQLHHKNTVRDRR
jgi:hypothetical protein